MQDFVIHVEIPIREAVGCKHTRGFPIAHKTGDRVRWLFVATKVNTESQDDNQQDTPPLMIVRATVSNACLCRTSAGVHMRLFRLCSVNKSLYNADLKEVIYVDKGQTCARLDVAGGFGRPCDNNSGKFFTPMPVVLVLGVTNGKTRTTVLQNFLNHLVSQCFPCPILFSTVASKCSLESLSYLPQFFQNLQARSRHHGKLSSNRLRGEHRRASNLRT